jgi:hypothetical protein
MTKSHTANQSRSRPVPPETKVFWAMFAVALVPVVGIASVLA